VFFLFCGTEKLNISSYTKQSKFFHCQRPFLINKNKTTYHFCLQNIKMQFTRSRLLLSMAVLSALLSLSLGFPAPQQSNSELEANFQDTSDPDLNPINAEVTYEKNKKKYGRDP